MSTSINCKMTYDLKCVLFGSYAGITLATSGCTPSHIRLHRNARFGLLIPI